MRSLFVLSILFAIMLFSGCSRSNDEPAVDSKAQTMPAEIRATVLQFEEQEQGVEPYPLRMIITQTHLRMDDGEGAKSYLLFDRQKQTIYNVNADDKTVLLIERQKLSPPTEGKTALEITAGDTSDMPALGAKKPVHKTLSTAGKRCYDVVAIPGLMPDVVEAMREYLLTLSSQQIENLDKTPVAMRDPCMLTNLIYHPISHLDFGFPLREWDYRGFVRELVDFGEEMVSSKLFKVTDGYRKMTLDRGGLHKE